MDGLHELTAAAASIDIDGQTYRLSPLRARDYGEIERRMLIGAIVNFLINWFFNDPKHRGELLQTFVARAAH